MFKRKKKNTEKPLFYYETILDQIDIALGAFFKNNEFFVLTIGSAYTEDVLQVVHRQMAEETETECGEFGLTVTLEFDKEIEEDLQKVKLLKQFKHFGNFLKKEEENMQYFSMLLPQEAEKASAICSELLIEIYGHKKNNHQIDCEFYEVE